jgi:hypothetical protein
VVVLSLKLNVAKGRYQMELFGLTFTKITWMMDVIHAPFALSFHALSSYNRLSEILRSFEFFTSHFEHTVIAKYP